MALGWGTPGSLPGRRVWRRLTAALVVAVAVLLLGRDGTPLVAAALVVVAWGVLRGRRAALPLGCVLAAWASVYGVVEGDGALVVAAVAAVVLLLVVRHELVGVLEDGRRRLTAEVAIAA